MRLIPRVDAIACNCCCAAECSVTICAPYCDIDASSAESAAIWPSVISVKLLIEAFLTKTESKILYTLLEFSSLSQDVTTEAMITGSNSIQILLFIKQALMEQI